MRPDWKGLLDGITSYGQINSRKVFLGCALAYDRVCEDLQVSAILGPVQTEPAESIYGKAWWMKDMRSTSFIHCPFSHILREQFGSEQT
jgi:hypothetical protein